MFIRVENQSSIYVKEGETSALFGKKKLHIQVKSLFIAYAFGRKAERKWILERKNDHFDPIL